MTAPEMQYSFQSKLQGLGYDPEFIDTYRIQFLLNEAQGDFVDRYAPFIDVDDVAKNKLITLINTGVVIPSAYDATNNISTYSYFATLPSGYRKILNEWLIESVGGRTIIVKPISYDEYNIEKLNPFKKPYAPSATESGLAWRLIYGASNSRKAELIVDSTTASAVGQTFSYKLRYITNPSAIDIFAGTACLLNATDHEEIVNIAISLLPTLKTK